MKVEQPRGAGALSSDSETRVSRSSDRSTQPARSDSVALSRDATLLSDAVNAAKAESQPRADAVARGRALLASGDSAVDLNLLADRIIDHLTHHDDDIA
jgi:hypothetical protein